MVDPIETLQELGCEVEDHDGDLSIWGINSELDDDTFYVLDSLARRITTIDVTSTRVTDRSYMRLAKMSRLHTLIANDAQVTDATLMLLRSCASLRKLHIAHNHLSPHAWEHLSRIPRLEYLEISFTKANLSPQTKDCVQLQELHLSGNDVHGSLHMLNGLPNLQRLALVSAAVDDADLRSLAIIDQLELLVLWNTKITDASGAPLRAASNLKELSANSTAVGDAFSHSVAGLPQLETITLSRTRVTDKGVAVFAQTQALKQLCIAATSVTAAGIEALASARQKALSITLDKEQVTPVEVRSLSKRYPHVALEIV